MKPIVVRGARVVDPSAGRDEIADVLLQDGVVRAVGRGLGTPDGAAVLVAVGPVLRAIAVASGGVLRPRRVLTSGVALTPRRAGS